MKINLCLITVVLLFFISCKKNPLQSSDSYLTTTSGSTWRYQLDDTTNGVGGDTLLTVTASSEDTIINGKIYNIYNHSLSSTKEYDRRDGNNYYTLQGYASLPVPGIIGKQGTEEVLYLKTDLPVGGSYILYDTVYMQNDLNAGEKFPIPIETTYTIIEKGISKTINNINYADVIHIFSSSSSVFFAPGEFVNTSDCYYAKDVGLIESYNIFHIHYASTFDQQFRTTLLSSNIK